MFSRENIDGKTIPCTEVWAAPSCRSVTQRTRPEPHHVTRSWLVRSGPTDLPDAVHPIPPGRASVLRHQLLQFPVHGVHDRFAAQGGNEGAGGVVFVAGQGVLQVGVHGGVQAAVGVQEGVEEVFGGEARALLAVRGGDVKQGTAAVVGGELRLEGVAGTAGDLFEGWGKGLEQVEGEGAADEGGAGELVFGDVEGLGEVPGEAVAFLIEEGEGVGHGGRVGHGGGGGWRGWVR